VTGSEDKTARVWDPYAADPEKTVRVLGGHEFGVQDLAISPDGRFLATTGTRYNYEEGDDPTVRLWDLQEPEPEKTPRVLSGHKGPVQSLAISEDGRYLVTGSVDNAARVWDLHAADPEKTVRVFDGHIRPVRDVAISPDSRYLVTGSERVQLWDLQSAQPERTVRVLRREDGYGYGGRLAISPDWRYVAVGNPLDNSACVWDLKAADPEKTLRLFGGHDRPVWASAFSPDGRYLLTASDRVRMWPLRLDELLRHAERAVGRNLTREEWEETFPGEEYRKTFEGLPRHIRGGF
jgi:WD40 repeat protein